jgi:hypothetical protein
MQAKLGNDALRAKSLENGCVDSHINGDRYGLDIAECNNTFKVHMAKIENFKTQKLGSVSSWSS